MKIEHRITFELKDYDKLINSYPNFRYNFNSFEEWVQSCIDNMLGNISDIEGVRITRCKFTTKQP